MRKADNLGAGDAKRALAIATSTELPMKVVLNRPTAEKTVNILALYRLVNVLHALNGRKVLGSNPRYARIVRNPSVGSRVSDASQR